MKPKIYCFYVILISPILLLVSIVLATLSDLHEIRRVDPAVLYRDLQEHLLQKGPELLPLPDKLFERDASKKTVYVFGESSLVLTDGRTFPDYLEQDHNDLRVVNLGVSGIDSFSIKQRVEDALSVAKPDIIVLYYGHNDYNNAYQGHILPRYYQKFDCLLRLADTLHGGVKHPLPGHYYSFSRLYRPKLYQTLQSIGAVNLDAAKFASMNQVILDYYIRNNKAIVDRATSEGIPVVLITPVGNLHAEPYGDVNTTTALYRKGTAETDYARSLAYLKAARDTEIFTYDLRAKSPLLDYIRSCSYPKVYVLDLERKLTELHFGFGYSDFLDYFHFNDKSHRLLAGLIYDFMKQKKLVGHGPHKQSP